MQKCLLLPLKLFKVNVSLSQMSWKTAPQFGRAAAKHVSIATVGPSDDTYVLELAERS